MAILLSILLKMDAVDFDAVIEPGRVKDETPHPIPQTLFG